MIRGVGVLAARGATVCAQLLIRLVRVVLAFGEWCERVTR